MMAKWIHQHTNASLEGVPIRLLRILSKKFNIHCNKTIKSIYQRYDYCYKSNFEAVPIKWCGRPLLNEQFWRLDYKFSNSTGLEKEEVSFTIKSFNYQS